MFSKRNAVNYSARDSGRGWKTFQMHSHPYFHRMRDAGGASLKVHKDYLARLGKRVKRVLANEGGVNLARDSSAPLFPFPFGSYAQFKTLPEVS